MPGATVDSATTGSKAFEREDPGCPPILEPFRKREIYAARRGTHTRRVALPVGRLEPDACTTNAETNGRQTGELEIIVCNRTMGAAFCILQTTGTTTAQNEYPNRKLQERENFQTQNKASKIMEPPRKRENSDHPTRNAYRMVAIPVGRLNASCIHRRCSALKWSP